MTAVSVDLGSGTTVGTSASIGVEAHVNWQQEFGFPNFTSTNLEDDSAAATTLDLEVAGAAGNFTSRASGAGDLFNMFTRGAGCRIELEDTEIIIDQIPYSNYNLYLYFCETSSSTSSPVYSFTDGTTTYYFETQGSDNFDSGTLTRVTSESPGAPDTTGNYVLFEGLTSSSVTITCNGDSGNANDVVFVGLQIVESITAANITASISEAGDTVSANINVVASVTGNIAESGDTITASLNAVASITANIVESGDIITANIVAGALADFFEPIDIESKTSITAVESKTSITALESKTSITVVA